MKLIGLLGLTLGLATLLIVMPTTTKYKTAAAGEAVGVYLAPNNLRLPPDGTLSLYLDAKTNQLAFARVTIKFDPQKVRLSSDPLFISKLSLVAEKTDIDTANQNGSLTVAAGLAYTDISAAPTGVVEMARFNFTSVSSTVNDSTTVSIDANNSQIVNLQRTNLGMTMQNVLLQLNGSTVTVAPTQSGSGTVTLKPQADAFVAAANTSGNYGQWATASVDGDPQKEVSYLKFDLTPLAGKTIKSAVLKYRVCVESNCGSGATQTIQTSENTSWGEMGITYNNRPTPGTTIATIGGGSAGSWKQINVTTGAVSKAGKLMTLVISQTGADGLDFYTKESADPEQLVITYDGGSVAPTTVPSQPAVPSSTPVPTSVLPTATPAPVSNADPIIFFQGDLVSGGTVAKAQKVVNQINKLMASHPGVKMYVASTGDNEQESAPTLANYQQYFGTTYGPYVSQNIFMQVRGNHDVQDTGHGAAYATYFGSKAHLDSNGQTNYSYDLGNWHILGLDQLNGTVNSNTLAFLKSDLAAHTGNKCQLVYWHVPTYSSGAAHGDSTGLKSLNQAEYDYGVDIQLNGHDHDYQRFYPINPSGVRDDAKGITTFVDGIGGQDGRSGSQTSIAQAASAKYLDAFGSGDAIGTIMFTLHSTSADYALYDANTGNILDQGTVNCH